MDSASFHGLSLDYPWDFMSGLFLDANFAAFSGGSIASAAVVSQDDPFLAAKNRISRALGWSSRVIGASLPVFVTGHLIGCYGKSMEIMEDG